MVDEVKGPGIDSGGSLRRSDRASRASPPAPPSAPPKSSGLAESGSIAPELRGRLGAVAGDLEKLLVRLTSIQERTRSGNEALKRIASNPAADSAERAGKILSTLQSDATESAALHKSITASQVAFQNILSADPEAPAAPPNAPPVHHLDRQNILQLLDQE